MHFSPCGFAVRGNRQTNKWGGGILYFVLEKLEIRNNRRIFVHENTMIYHNDKY